MLAAQPSKNGHESKTAFTRCRHILKTMKNVTVAKFELAFTRCRNNLKLVGNLPVKSSLQDFDAKEVCLHLRIDQSRSKSVEKFSVFIIYKCSQNIVSKMFRFQNLPFSKFAGKKCAVFV